MTAGPIFLNDPTWVAQHVESDLDQTECGLPIAASGFAPIPSRRVFSTKPLCIICFEALWEPLVAELDGLSVELAQVLEGRAITQELWDKSVDANVELRTENERLVRHRETWKERQRKNIAEIVELRAQNERLRAEIEGYRAREQARARGPMQFRGHQ